MIEFSGTISKNCKNYIKNREKKISFVGLSGACLVFLIPFIILSFKNQIFLLVVATLLFLPLFAFSPISERSLQSSIPEEIKINNNIIISKGKNFEYKRQTSSIKKIIDFGDWYHVFFNYANRCENFICQKDLIKEGTIEDFEKMFEDKIVRKTK